MTTDPYRCRWCGEAFVVPSLARLHEETCPMRTDERGDG